MKEEHIQLRLTKKQKEKLQEKAEREGMSVSEAIRFLIYKWLDK